MIPKPLNQSELFGSALFGDIEELYNKTVKSLYMLQLYNNTFLMY